MNTEVYGIDRRRFLRLATTTVLGTLALPVVQACQQPSPPGQASGGPGAQPPAAAGPAVSATAGGPDRLVLPAQVPFAGPKPDLDGSPDGLIAPGYVDFPKNLVKSVARPPGAGGDVNVLTVTLNPPPTPLDENVAWQQVNKELGVSLKMPIVGTKDYPARLATTIAGNDLPDIVGVSVFGSVFADMPGFLQAACADLTPHLSGDAVKEYPNLANFPAYAWKPSVFNKRIYAVPAVGAGIKGQALNIQGKLLDQAGKTGFTSFDDFTAFLKQVTIPAQRWGIGAAGANLYNSSYVIWFLQCLGGPNVWRETGGKLTRDWETDEFKAAVTFARGLWDAGLVHPDSASLSGSPAGTVFYAGKMAMWITGFNNVPTVWDRAVGTDPGFKPRVVVPFSHDGKAKPVHFLGPGAQALMAVKKGSQERVKQMLGVLNFLAAPFGTQEYLLLNYGVEGVDFSFDGAGNPVPTKQGSQDLNVPWKFAMAPPEALYNATSRDYASVRHEQQAAILPLGIQNPTIGLYSKTDEAQGGALLLKMFDGINQIIFGQASLSTFDSLVGDWRRNGGDQMRGEYEQAIQASRA